MCIRDSNGLLREFEQLTDLILRNQRVVDLPYEMLVTDPHLWLAKFVEAAELENVVNDQWFEQTAALLTPPTKEDPNSHKRRVKPGNWVDYFDEELESLCKRVMGDRLAQFGYTW